MEYYLKAPQVPLSILIGTQHKKNILKATPKYLKALQLYLKALEKIKIPFLNMKITF